MSLSNISTPPIWTSGPILAAVQQAGLFDDSKDFVDSPLLVSPDECWARWNKLVPSREEDLRAFVNETFGAPGHDLEAWTPTDYQASPLLLARLPAGTIRDWAAALNDLWPKLGRRLSNTTLAHPERTTLLPVRHGFIIPGGRFRESYYWDSYWVVLGLLAVGMDTTAESLTANLLDAVRQYGFVPNGMRSYYLNRSQPPMLTQMIGAIVDHCCSSAQVPAHASTTASATTGDLGENTCTLASRLPSRVLRLLDEALPVLDAEYAWWMRSGANSSAVELDARGATPSATLNRYVVGTELPRPESYREDIQTASFVDAAARPRLYAELAAGAESGWDYSSRWLNGSVPSERSANHDDLSAASLDSLVVSSILPVELNAILYRNERRLEQLHLLRAAVHSPSAAAERQAAVAYAAAASARRAAMDEWMWSAESGRWHDVDLTRGERLPGESAASYTPLWAGAHGADQAAAAVSALHGSQLLQSGGLATTLEATGQQWDWPNAWPPLQQMVVEGLVQCGLPEGKALGSELARRWLTSNLLGWSRDGVMHEKYDATRPGERGGGGEYVPQVGFGWTNGVVLWLLEAFVADGGPVGAWLAAAVRG